MHYIHCLNNISKYGTDLLPESYELTDEFDEATGILVRSAAMHDMEFPESLLAIGRAGAGVNNIPIDRCAEEGIVVFNTPGANANAVKEIVVCGLMLGSRDIAGGIAWCRHNADDENIAKAAEKAKKAFAGREVKGKKLGVFWGTLIGGVARFLVHYVVGATIWAAYMPDTFFGMTMTSPWIYSLLYNIAYMGPNIIITLVIFGLLYVPMKKYMLGQDIR